MGWASLSALTQQLDDEVGNDAGADAPSVGARRAGLRGDDVLATGGTRNLLTLLAAENDFGRPELEPLGPSGMHADLLVAADGADAIFVGDGRRSNEAPDGIGETDGSPAVVSGALLLLRGDRRLARGRSVRLGILGVGRLGRRLKRGHERRFTLVFGGVKRERVATEGKEELLALLGGEALAAGAEDHARVPPRDVFLLDAALTKRGSRLAQERACVVPSPCADEQVGGIEGGVERHHALGHLLLEGFDEQALEDSLAHRLELFAREAKQLGRQANATLLL